jgi:hypothetical protein
VEKSQGTAENSQRSFYEDEEGYLEDSVSTYCVFACWKMMFSCAMAVVLFPVGKDVSAVAGTVK